MTATARKASRARLVPGKVIEVDVGSRTFPALVVEDRGPVLQDDRHLVRLRAFLEGQENLSEFDLSLDVASVRTPALKNALRFWISANARYDDPRWLDLDAFRKEYGVKLGDVADALSSLATAQEIRILDSKDRQRLVSPS